MTATESHNGRTTPTDPDDLRTEIQQTRADLGETVEALAAKADIKARAQESVANVKVRAREQVELAKVNATQVAREFRTDPVGRLRDTATRVGRSVTENPRPWAVAGAFLALALFIGSRRGRGR